MSDATMTCICGKIHEKVTDEALKTLYDGLMQYHEAGVKDPWVFEDGTIIDPLDVVRDLIEERKK